MEMIEEVRQVVCGITGLAPDFDTTANLYADLGVPSVQAMQLLTELEERFGIALPDEDFIEAVSLQDLSSLVGRIKGA
ncbi:MAG: acyl carrier protein [Paludibaculum sp.]